MATKIIMTDGKTSQVMYKALDPYTDETPGVWVGNQSKIAKSARLVPSMFAGISARTQAMADLPFTIYSVRGDKPLDDSDRYKNVIGLLPYPSRTFSLAEGSLTLAGRAYWWKDKGTKTGTVKSLTYWIPQSVTLDNDKLKNGEIYFRRSGMPDLLSAEQVLYMWGIDPEVELGPPLVWAYESALLAAEASGAITAWIADYMRRGAVKAMMLMVDGMPPPSEVERMEGWFNRFMTGTKNLGWKVFNNAGVKPTIIGDGLEALKDLSINAELRYEIHTALGTRHLLEDENYATANARERQFYTMTIMPDARLIQYAMNEQILHAMGYHLEFEPERLEIFQDDESAQADSFLKLFEGFDKVMSTATAFQLASEKLDYQFTDEQMALIKQGMIDKQKPTSVIPIAAPINNLPPDVVKVLVELDTWQNKVEKAGKMVTWHAVNLSPELYKSIKAGEMTFEQARELITRPETDSVKALADAINAAVNG